MEEWLKISLRLCLFGFFNGMAPFAHFMFKFLTEVRGISEENVTDFFLAQFSYWNLGLLAIVFLFTDMLRYKPLVILSALSNVVYHVVMLWTEGLYPLIACAALLGLQLATDVAYLTYIYAMVDKQHYPQVTANSRSAALIGRCTGAVLAQFLMIYEVVTVEKLGYMALTCNCIAFCVSLTLPAVRTSIYFYQAPKRPAGALEEDNNRESSINNSTFEIVPRNQSQETHVEDKIVKFSWKNAKSLLWSHFKSGYSNPTVQLWSVWWALMQCGFRMAYTYNQPLWHFIEPDRVTVFNGFAEAGLTLFGAFGAQLAGILNPRFVEKSGMWIMLGCAVAQGSFSILAGRTGSVFVSYAMYIIIGAVYYFMVTVCATIVAKNLVQDSFGLIFGINTWLALLFTNIFTIVVVSGTVFRLNPIEQYTIYGCYFFALVLVFGAYYVYRVTRGNKRTQ